MSKTKPQGMMINKIMVFWQTHMIVLTFAVIDHKTTNIPEISLECSCFCQSFTSKFIEDVYKKTTKACL